MYQHSGISCVPLSGRDWVDALVKVNSGVPCARGFRENWTRKACCGSCDCEHFVDAFGFDISN